MTQNGPLSIAVDEISEPELHMIPRTSLQCPENSLPPPLSPPHLLSTLSAPLRKQSKKNVSVILLSPVELNPRVIPQHWKRFQP